MNCLKVFLSVGLSIILSINGSLCPVFSRTVLAAESVQEDTFSEEETISEDPEADTDSEQIQDQEQARDSEQIQDQKQARDLEQDSENAADKRTEESFSDEHHPENSGEESAEEDFDRSVETEVSEDVSVEPSREDFSGSTASDEPVGENIIDENVPKEDSKDTALEESVSGDSADDKDDGSVVVDEPGEEEIWIPAKESSSDGENDDIFAAYVNREFGLEGSLKADTGDYQVSEPARKSNYASTRLTGYNRTIYALLIGKIRKVAAGELSSTVFEVSLGDLGLSDKTWSAQDLGVEAITQVDENGKRTITAESKNALNELIGINLKVINQALLADCPYDFYWYDKTKGVSRQPFSFNAAKEEGEWRLYYTRTKKSTFSFKVAKEYSKTGEIGTCETNSEIGQAVLTAHANALGIVKKYENESDYEKMDGYRQEICDAVSYNSEASSSNTIAYGNPWQLIWTFDNDPDTKVVCEGYSKSFQYLCDLSSWNTIFKECISVTGYLHGTSSPHMWNIVTLRDGTNYLADITNCDDGMVGKGNGGRNLFLVGTGDYTVDKSYASGSAQDGYTFPGLSSSLHYTYDSDAFSRFGLDRLMLSSGKVTAGTAADGEYNGNHEHICLVTVVKEATCTETGISRNECAICGDIINEEIPLLPHTPGEWTVKTAPTYDAEGVSTTVCAVCGAEMEKAVPRLIPVTGIVLDKESITLHKGETQELKAAVEPADATDQKVIWYCEDYDVATVTSLGVVEGVGNGTTKVTAKSAYGDGAFSRSCQVTVTTPVSGISLDKTSISLLKGESQTLKATVQPGDASDQTVIWQTEDVSVATVTSSGVVKGVGKGTTKVTARTQDGGFTSDCLVTVTPLYMKDMQISVSGTGYTYDGKAKTPGVTVFSKQLNRTLISGKDYDVSYLNNINVGTAKIDIAARTGTAFEGSVTRTFSIGQYTLSKASATVVLSAEALVYNGSPKTPTVIVTAGGRMLVNGKDCTISYGNNINAGTGTASLTVTGKGNYKGSVTKSFSISRASQKITASAKTGIITAGQETYVTVSGAKGTKTFTSSNTSVAVVGKSTGKVTAKKAGTVKITVRSSATGNYQAASKTVTVKVLPGAVKKLTAVNLTKGIKTVWEKVDGANGYDLYRDGIKIKSLNSGNILSYTDEKAKTNGRKYTYTVIARAVTGTSRQKKSIAVYRLSTPVVKNIKNNAPGSMTLTWGKNEKASGYQIQYSLYRGFANTATIKTITVTKAGTVTRIISNLKKGKVWYVRIRAYRAAADGSRFYSEWKSSRCTILK